MTPLPSIPFARFFPALLLLTSLSACAAAPRVTEPARAQNSQLQQILQLQRQQGKQIQDLTEQLTKLQKQLGSKSPAPTTAELTPTPPAPAPEPAAVHAANPAKIPPLSASAAAFRSAFSDLAAGHFAAAESEFTSFLDHFAEHQYAVNARYWLADAQFAQQKWSLAANNLRQILADPAGTAKAPAALLKLAQIYDQQGKTDDADHLLEQLRTRYPDSLEAQHFFRSEPSP